MSTLTTPIADSKCSTAPKSRIEHDVRFAGKTVIVTGAGGQFGRAGCLYFARRGCRIAALDVVPDMLKETHQLLQQEIGSDGNLDFCAWVCDVTSADGVQAVVQQIADRFGGDTIQYLWNNAGYQGQFAKTLDYDPKDFARVMEINVTGQFIVLQAVAKQMIASGCKGCSIVNTASVAGMHCTPGMIAYSASKSASISLTITAAKDLAEHNIRVNAVSPALIGPGTLWERQNRLHAEQIGPPYYATDAEQVGKDKVNSVPLKRLGSVEEVLHSVAFLFSDESAYTTAFNMVVDGGIQAGMR